MALLEPSLSCTEKLVGKPSSTSATWLLDSGAFHHMIGNFGYFSTTTDITLSPVGLPDGVKTTAVKEGAVAISSGVILCRVLYVPNLSINLISIGQLTIDMHCYVTFTLGLCLI